jgi:hypothetical protein
LGLRIRRFRRSYTYFRATHGKFDNRCTLSELIPHFALQEIPEIVFGGDAEVL